LNEGMVAPDGSIQVAGDAARIRARQGKAAHGGSRQSRARPVSNGGTSRRLTDALADNAHAKDLS
jgi:hypothetical protein